MESIIKERHTLLDQVKRTDQIGPLTIFATKMSKKTGQKLEIEYPRRSARGYAENSGAVHAKTEASHVCRGHAMSIFSLEHSKVEYYADFVLYSLAVVALAIFLLLDSPREQWLATVATVLVGLASWTSIEYALHRFVLHVLPPFCHWHALHHQRPMALICTPTILSASLIITLIFLPMLAMSNLWRASAMTLGILAGYLLYSIVHHAIHHWHVDNAWLKKLKYWHGQHHHTGRLCCFGVTSTFWDRVCGSACQNTASYLREHR